MLCTQDIYSMYIYRRGREKSKQEEKSVQNRRCEERKAVEATESDDVSKRK